MSLIKSAQDYYPFGMQMPSRTSNSDKYRFGFNGKENDNEVKGTGNSLDFGARIYDSRLGRWLSVDQAMRKYPHLSPYNAFENSPIFFKDPDGKDAEYSICGNTITISTTLIISGSGDNAMKAEEISKQLSQTWNEQSCTVNGQTYNIKFDIKVKSVEDATLSDITNFGSNAVYLTDKISNGGKACVIGGNKGVWHTEGGVKERAHEFGHFMGFVDMYAIFDIPPATQANTSQGENIQYYGIVQNNPDIPASDPMTAEENSRNKDHISAPVLSEDSKKAIVNYVLQNKNSKGKGVFTVKSNLLKDKQDKHLDALRRKSFEVTYPKQ